jgi:hypothetical protein
MGAAQPFSPNLAGLFLLLVQRSAKEGNYRQKNLRRKGFEMRENALVMG